MIANYNHNCPHKDKKHSAHGLCHSCYEKIRYHFYPGYKEKNNARVREWQRNHVEYCRKKDKLWRKRN